MNETPDRLATPHERASAAKHAWSQGAEPDALAVLENDPALLADRSAFIDLAFEEFCRRSDAGEAPDPEAFVARFPAHQTSLRNVLLMHLHFLQDARVLEEDLTPRWPQAGEQVGDLTLLRLLGVGAFARVFLASEESAGGRLVAVKFSPEGAAEARVLGPLDHPNVVPVLSVQRDEDRRLTAVRMPYRGSATLEDAQNRAFPAKEVPTAPRRAALFLEVARDGVPDGAGEAPDPLLARADYVEGVLHLGAQIADALAFLHGRGLCHRDLKPSNVLLSPGGRPLLLDFNLSADVGVASPYLGGTLPYMAPEQLEGFLARDPAAAPRLDERADLFALGVILYELLTGRHPFESVPLSASAGERARRLLERQREGCRPLRGLVDRRLARLVEGCLALEPAARPVSARAVARALRRQLGWLPRLRRWAKRRPAAAACLAACLAAGLALTGWAGAALVPASGPEADYRRGVEALRAGRLVEAEDRLGRAVRSKGPEAPAHYFFAWGVAQMKQATELAGPQKASAASYGFTSATEAFKAALRIQQAGRPPAPPDPRPVGLLGLLAAPRAGGLLCGTTVFTEGLLGQGATYASPDTALRLPPAVEGRLDEGPTHACLAYCAARLQAGDGRGPAVEESVKTIRAGYREAEVWNNLAVCLGRNGQTAEATALVERALAQKPDLLAAVYNRAVLAYQARQAEGLHRPGKLLPARALEDIEKALRTEPAGYHPYYYASRLYAYASLDLAPGDAETKALYQDRSVETLRLARDHGYRGVITRDRVLRTALGGHPGFAALLAEGPKAGHASAGDTSAALELAEPPVETLLTP